MKLTPMDLLPVLTIVTGGVLGASLSFGPLRSRPEDVRAPDPAVAPSATDESVLRSMLYLLEQTDIEAAAESARNRLEEQKAITRAIHRSSELLEFEAAAESASDPLRVRFLEEYQRLALDRMEQVSTDVEKLQEEGWDVTFRPPVFRLPDEIRQR